ncbi:MAG: molybdenum cofactor guanylyltransferase MobA [Halopseudomonas yangmingensis]
MPNTSFALLSGLLLAGGQGSRLGGRDKGLMQWRGEVVSARLASLLRPRVGQLLISCNRNQASYAQWADQLVGDPLPDYPGPMAGMLAGLRACRGSHLLVLPCDLPALDGALLDALLECAATQPEQPCLVRAGEQWQPLLCVLPRHCLDSLEAYWADGGRSPLRWILRQSHGIVELPEADIRLHNANHPEDWAQT